MKNFIKKFIKNWGIFIVVCLTNLGISISTDANLAALIVADIGLILMLTVCGLNWVIFD
jgi:hypothetical protein